MFKILALILIANFLNAQILVPEKVGFVTIQRIIDKSELGKIDKKLTKEALEAVKVDLKKKEVSIMKAKQYLQSQLSVLNPEAKKNKINEILKQESEIIAMTKQKQNDIQKEHNERVIEILQKIESIVEDVAEENEFDLVVSDIKNGVAYAKAKTDLTEEVIYYLNEE